MKNDINRMSETKRRIVEGLELAASRLLNEKRKNGTKLVTVLNGKIVHLSVEEYEQAKAEGKF